MGDTKALQNSPLSSCGTSEEFPEHRDIARILKFGVGGIFDEIEKRCEASIAGSLG